MGNVIKTCNNLQDYCKINNKYSNGNKGQSVALTAICKSSAPFHLSLMKLFSQPAIRHKKCVTVLSDGEGVSKLRCSVSQNCT